MWLQQIKIGIKELMKVGMLFFFFKQLTHTRDKPHSHVYVIDFVEHCFLRNEGFHFTESTGAYINLLFIRGGRETHDRKDMK